MSEKEEKLLEQIRDGLNYQYIVWFDGENFQIGCTKQELYQWLHCVRMWLKRRRTGPERVFSFDMQKWAESFYKSTAWKNCRNSYVKSVGGLCEDCYKKGIVKAAEEVHHIKHLTKQNINDPNVSLAWSNLVALCHDCHMKRHYPHTMRYKIDEYGRVIPND